MKFSWRSLPLSSALKLIRFWPPYLGAGISVAEVDPQVRFIKVQMKLSWKNTNYVGTHFGGSLFSMTDPWYMLMLIENLGKDYVVWDKAAEIHFRRPGTGKVTAEFRIDQALIDELRAEVAQHGKTERALPAEILNEAGEVVAEVTKTIWIAYKHRDRKTK